MLRIYANQFTALLSGLAWAAECFKSMAKENPAQMLWPELRNVLKESMERTCTSCKDMGLTVSFLQAERVREAVNGEGETKIADLQGLFDDLGQRVRDELQDHIFMYVPSRMAKYMVEDPFGKDVADKLPKQAEDIAEAAKCICFGRHTAGVFHLMRAMESLLARLAKVLRLVPFNTDRAWGKMLRDIDNAIAKLPGAFGVPGNPREQARYEKIAGIAAYLHHVKDAWRNTTMHPKRTYTEEEADHLFANVRTFAQSLVRLR